MKNLPLRLLPLLCLLVDAPAAAPDKIEFNKHVRPILSDNCFACHGFDAKKRKADLRLDEAAGAMAARDKGAGIVPGDLAKSLVWKHVNSTDPEEVMPPPSSKKTLSPEQKDILRRWIEQGAPYQKHWAFEAVSKPNPPEVGEWAKNEVDHFILARLKAEGLAPQPEASKETLIRRVAFTLTGLPPSIAEVEQFLADTSAGAYEAMVERYLQSRHYGEEMARHWLDVARYADTHGLHLDNERHMWLYRDWVIKAFNQNLPFDQFTTWQLAGDLLPNPSNDQLVATGYNRCNVTTAEGGAINEEWLYRYAVDRTSNMTQTWLGLTGGCAVCHDHKFDPLSAKEFYSLYAFFYSAADPGMDGNVNDTKPFLRVPSPELESALKAAKEAESTAEQVLDAALAKLATSSESTTSALREVTEHLLDEGFPIGSKATSSSRNDPVWLLDPAFGAKSGRRVLELASADAHNVKVDLAFLPILVPQDGEVRFWLRVDRYETPANITITIQDKTLRLSADKDATRPLPPGDQWTLISLSCEQLGLKPGQRIRSLTLNEQGGRCWVDGLSIAGKADAAKDPLASFDAWWRACKELDLNSLPSELREAAKAGPDRKPRVEIEAKLRRFFLTKIQRPSHSPAPREREALEAARLTRVALEESIPGTFIFKELDKPRQAYVMLRGQYDKPGDKVEPGVPAVFPALKKEKERASRLDLARWLLSPDHPLTARVTVNRFWQQVFGTGLTKTSYDFGSQGEAPSHPELLDWLAQRFASDWDMKDFLRLLVTSATFRQESLTLPVVQSRDPENRLYARGPRLRLDAEQIRDNALFVSGLINMEMGGRGVMTYQPPNIWEPVGYQDSNTRFYLQDHGPALYRRGIYCFLKRTGPPPFMSNFDGPNREQFCTRRERSNTPLQALQLMNDVQHFEAARSLAERVLAQATADDQRVDLLYRTVLSRRPNSDEIATIKSALQTQRELFDADPEAAKKALSFGESTPRSTSSETAAWTLVANLVLNLDETVNRN